MVILAADDTTVGATNGRVTVLGVGVVAIVVVVVVDNIESEIGLFSTFGIPPTKSSEPCCDNDIFDAFGMGGGGNTISLDVISLNMVCQTTSVTLANNTRYSDGKLYVIRLAGVQTFAFAINNGTNLACICAGICRMGEPLNNAGMGISHTV